MRFRGETRSGFVWGLQRTEAVTKIGIASTSRHVLVKIGMTTRQTSFAGLGK